MLSRTQSVINQVSHSLKTTRCASYSRSFSTSGNANKGFASMPKEKVQEIGSMGGRAHSDTMKSDRIVGDHGASRRDNNMDHNDAADRRTTNNSTQQNGMPHNANINNVVGGYKATINNPNVSNQAKANAENVLNNLENSHPGITEDSVATKSRKGQSSSAASTSTAYASNSNNTTQDVRSMANQIYDQSSKGDRIGEAPVSQRRMEMAHNETVEHDPSTGSLEHSESFHNKNINNVIGGYKATINNPNVGQHAKARAEHLLKELESEHPGITEDSIATKSKKNQIHVGTEDPQHSTSTLDNNTYNSNNTHTMSTGRTNSTNNYSNTSEAQNGNRMSNTTNQGRNDYVTMSQVQDMINPLAATLNRIEQQLSSGNRATNNRSDQESHGKQGFASMPKEKVQEIASMGGRSHGQSHTNDSNHGANSSMDSMSRASADANRRDSSAHNVVGNERNTQRK